MIFKFLPDLKIPWRNTWLGAALSALLFNFGKFVLGFYLAKKFHLFFLRRRRLFGDYFDVGLLFLPNSFSRR